MDNDSNEMSDAVFLARQMYLTGLQDPLQNVNIHVNHEVDDPVLNQVVLQGKKRDIKAGNQHIDQAGNQQNHQAGDQQGNQVGNQQADHAANQQADQGGNQQADYGGNLQADQARHQVLNLAGNLPAHQAGNLPCYPLMTLNVNQRNQPVDYFGIGNLVLPQHRLGHGGFQGSPQGFDGLENQRVNLDNLRHQFGQRRQRHQRNSILEDNAQANRLMGIINNLELELQRSRQVYRTLYGPILGNENHDAGYWKRLYFQEKKKSSRNQGKNLYFFNK